MPINIGMGIFWRW